ADAALVTTADRERERARVDAAVGAWTSALDGATAAALLQAAGIPAAVAVRASQLATDEQLWARDFYRLLDRAEVGTHPYPGPVVRLTDTPAVIERPAPLYGQHTDQVLRELLGLSDDELDHLRAAGVTSTEPLAQDWR
ncbi:MAG: CoA transferase, partial [Ilumatobacteraceae bacterium]